MTRQDLSPLLTSGHPLCKVVHPTIPYHTFVLPPQSIGGVHLKFLALVVGTPQFARAPAVEVEVGAEGGAEVEAPEPEVEPEYFFDTIFL